MHKRSFGWITIKIYNKIKGLKVPTYEEQLSKGRQTHPKYAVRDTGVPGKREIRRLSVMAADTLGFSYTARRDTAMRQGNPKPYGQSASYGRREG